LSVHAVDRNYITSNCQILYIAGSERGSYRSLEIITKKNPVLTISELAGFVQAGGIVELNDAKGKIQFDINLDVAFFNGLTISSRLLSLAHYIKWDTKP